MSEQQRVEIDLDKLRARMLRDVITEADVDLLFALLDDQHRQLADLSRQIGELNTTIGYQDAMLAQLRTALRDTIYRIEDVLEGAEIDDGIVQVSALTRLDEHYFGVLKPMRDEVMKATA